MSAAADSPYWIGFDLGGTKMLAVVYDAEFKRVGRKRRRTKGHEGADAGVERMIATIRDAAADAGIEMSQVAGIGVGCPGPVDVQTGAVTDAANLGWSNVSLRDTLNTQFDCHVAVVNDVDAGIYGEYRFGAAAGAHCAVGVFPGTGIGGGCVYQGEIFRGAKLSAMEIGHTQVTPNGRLCGCGRWGCLETEASRLAISAQAAKAAYRGEAPHLLENVGTDMAEIRSGALAAAIEGGDTIIEQIVIRAANMIGVAVGNLVTLLSPDVVILGGGLVEAMPDLFVERVEKSASKTVMPPYIGTFKVKPARLGDDASVLGAAAWAAKTAAAKT